MKIIRTLSHEEHFPRQDFCKILLQKLEQLKLNEQKIQPGNQTPVNTSPSTRENLKIYT